MGRKKATKEKMRKKRETKIGTFVGNEHGYGFVEFEGEKEDLFIPPTKTKSAMNGDLVSVYVVNEKEGTHRAEGEIQEVLERRVKTLVGVYTKQREYGFVEADDKKIFSDIYIPSGESKKAKTNDKVVVAITRYPSREKKAEGKIIEVLGNAEDTRVDLLAVLRTYGYSQTFPRTVQKEAAIMPQVVRDCEGRVDLREKEIFTIDGADTKDIDDAVSLERVGKKYRLGVHIADVSHYVQEGSALDREAAKRGTSVYLIDAVIPMLPKELSNGICSLNPKEDRFALSITIDLDENANVLQSHVYKSVICSKKKMTYDDVYKVMETDTIPGGYEPFVKTLREMKELAIKLVARRHEKGAIDFDLPEAHIVLDEKDRVLSIEPYPITIANRVIEQFMVLANECIAKTFSEKKLPFLYRVHEKPDAEKLQRLEATLNHLNLPTIFSKEVQAKEMQKVMEKVQGRPEEKVVSMMALRTMKLARYEPENLGHFGLALENYCHFTSPIRRYPDLFIHRVISGYLAKELDEKRKKKLTTLAIRYAQTSSDMEQKAEEAERELEEIKKCEYMAEQIGEEFDGIISGVTSFGVFVELPNTIEGFIRVEQIQGDVYTFQEDLVALVGEHTKKMYQMGDSVHIRVVGANRATRRINFEFCHDKK